ncbi:heparan-alpha-glucosaminide N-acetyltransferase domain-containing protein [Schlesneria paludicola]|uniref:heparan-alpha-glucosaminide N-acetyltransferase domain-containing protein n=1 Tax=Schlesneria paludicola TaxID=360056 RepID=UPI00029A79F9|nr:heparan-alpha-glucosaminide N-acetyltransferase domain-containing protein [Schlesneria paludicola]
MAHDAPLTTDSPDRVISMDQFRGYAVAAMIFVNFVGGFGVVHSVFKHNDNYLSYADTIMANFMFMVGFSFRLTMLRRLKRMSWLATCWSYVRRSLLLVFVSTLLYGIAGDYKSWSQFQQIPETLRDPSDPPPSESESQPRGRRRGRPRDPAQEFRDELKQMTPEEQDVAIHDERLRRRAEREKERSNAKPADPAKTSLFHPEFRKSFFANWRVSLARHLKSNLWETFAIIGMSQLVILPLVPLGMHIRLAAMFGLALVHALLCYWFNWGFVLGFEDNWMVQIWKTGTSRSWDGGFFGPLCWGVVMLGGTIAYDVVMTDGTRWAVIVRLLRYGVFFTVLGYIFSCGTRLYDIVDGGTPQRSNITDIKFAESPMVPSLSGVNHRSPLSLLAEPPFIAPPPGDERLENYWMMSKKFPTLSYILCATGLSFLLYAAFVWFSDIRHFEIGIFRTFGTNPLLAYCINELAHSRFKNLLPGDAPLWYCLLAFVLYFGMIYACVRYFERQKMFIRL